MEPTSTAFPGSQQGPSTPTGRPVRRSKQSVAEAFLAKLHERGDIDLGAPGFVESVCAHFERLPTRYALDVNIESLDVLSHKRLLEEARSDPATVSFAVRSVEVLHTRHSSDSLPTPAFPTEVSSCRGGRLMRECMRPSVGFVPWVQAAWRGAAAAAAAVGVLARAHAQQHAAHTKAARAPSAT
jgi:hypothetical protein